MEKLAIQGGTPVRADKIFYGRQWISEEDIQAVSETLRSPLITCGPKVEEMQRKLCEYTGASYSVAVCNGTAALHCACMAAGIGPGDEVITTPITFAASANCAFYCGARPVFADIDPETYNIDPESIRAHITERTKAVVAVDFAGTVTDVQAIRSICDEYHLIYIADAAHSIGSSYDGKRVGTLADMTCMSFHPVKTVTGGEGGAVLTNDPEFYRRLMLMRTHGITHDNEDMVDPQPDEPWYYEQVALGYNYRITDFQAALLISQMDRLDDFVQRRKEIVAKYNEAFSQIPELILQKELPQADNCHHLYIIQLNLDLLTCTRTEFFHALSAENIQPQVHYVPVYWFPYYQEQGFRRGICPRAEYLYERIMSIPLYPMLTDEDVEDVIHAVKKLVENYRK